MQPLYLTNNPNLGSTARILQSWIRLGREQGFTSRVVLQRTGDFARWLERSGTPHRVDPMPWMNRRWPLPSLNHAWGVARWARRGGVGVIHANEHDVYPFASLVRWMLNRPTICHVRFRINREFAEWAFGGRHRPDALLWTSYRQQADCRDAVEGIVPDERQHVVRLGIDLETFGNEAGRREAARSQWGIRPDEIVIGTASPLRPRKKVEDFVTLVAELARRNEKVVGILAGGTIAGDEDYADCIARQIRETGLGRRLQWVGNLEPVEPLYHVSDIVISTSEYETFGNSVCEAMSCRRPVVGYRGGSVSEVVGDTGLIVETGDLPGLVAAAQRLADDVQLRLDPGFRARQRVAEYFNPVKSFEQLKSIHAGLVRPSRPTPTAV